MNSDTLFQIANILRIHGNNVLAIYILCSVNKKCRSMLFHDDMKSYLLSTIRNNYEKYLTTIFLKGNIFSINHIILLGFNSHDVALMRGIRIKAKINICLDMILCILNNTIFCASQYAAKCGYLNALKYFVSLGVYDIFDYDYNILRLATENNRLSTVKYITQSKDNNNYIFERGIFHCAVRCGHIGIIKYFVSLYPRSFILDHLRARNYRIVICAYYRHHTNVIRYFMSLGINSNEI